MSGVGGDVRGYNMFAYCFNNPINMIDVTGSWPSWNDIKEGFNKAIDKIADVFANLTKPIEVQIGVGLGLGGDISDTVTAEFCRDTYVGIDDGKIVTGNVIVTEVSVFDSNIGIGDTYDHRVEEGGQKVSNSARPWDGPFDMMNYPDVTHGNEFAIPFIAVNSEGDLLISLGASVHLGIGGRISIAYNITELIELF